MPYKLSILIPTLPERFHYLQDLRRILDPQVLRFKNDVEVKYHDGGKHLTTGEKRNILINQAEGEYTVFIDDDDHIPVYYVDEILKHIESRPDVVGFKGWMTTNGSSKVDFEIRKGHPYIEVTRESLKHYPHLAHLQGWYVRFPNILTPMKREISSAVKFPMLTRGEDYPWAERINYLGLIKTESFIDKWMYHYDFKVELPITPRLRR